MKKLLAACVCAGLSFSFAGTGLICTPAKDNDEWESYRKIFDFIPEPPESNIPPCK